MTFVASPLFFCSDDPASTGDFFLRLRERRRFGLAVVSLVTFFSALAGVCPPPCGEVRVWDELPPSKGATVRAPLSIGHSSPRVLL